MCLAFGFASQLYGLVLCSGKSEVETGASPLDSHKLLQRQFPSLLLLSRNEPNNIVLIVMTSLPVRCVFEDGEVVKCLDFDSNAREFCRQTVIEVRRSACFKGQGPDTVEVANFVCKRNNVPGVY